MVKSSSTTPAFQMLRSTSKPVRLEILRLLKDAGPVTFSQIKNALKENGAEYHDGQLWKHLENLVESKLVEPIANENTGRTMIRACVFYQIRREGELMVKTYDEIEQEIRKIRAKESSSPRSSFLESVHYSLSSFD